MVDWLMIGDAWRPVVKSFSLILGILVFSMFWLMRDKAQKHVKKENVGIVKGLLTVCRNPQSWYNALFAGLIFLPTAAFGEYWGIQYLSKTNMMIDKHQAVVAVNMIFIGWAIGGICCGALSDYIQKRRPILLVSPLLCLVTLLPALYWHQMPAWTLYGCLGLYGLFNSGLVVAYALSGEINPDRVCGVSIAFCNMLSVLFGTFALPVMGMIIDHYADIVDGKVLYTTYAYEQAVIFFPAALVLAWLCALCVRETHCQQVFALTQVRD
jgi:MFS family permease